MSAYFLSPKVSLLSCVGGCLPLCASRGFPFVCVYVLSSSPSDEIISLVLSCPGEQQGSEQGDTKKESLGGEGCCHPGVPGWPSCRLLEPGTWESWEEGAWGASHFRSPCSPQAPAGQRPLPAPGLPEGAPAPGHARCCPLGQQASEELWGEAPEKPVAPMLFNIVQRLKTLKQNKRAFFSGNDSGQWRLWFSRQRGPLLQESVP